MSTLSGRQSRTPSGPQSGTVLPEGPHEAQHEVSTPVLDEQGAEFEAAVHSVEMVEYEFRGPFTVEPAPLAAIVKDADGEVVGHLVDVPICPALDFGTALFRVVNDEADKMAQAMIALWELGRTIADLQEAEADLPDDQKNPALKRLAEQWTAEALPLVQDDLAFSITEAGEQAVKVYVDGGEYPFRAAE